MPSQERMETESCKFSNKLEKGYVSQGLGIIWESVEVQLLAQIGK